MNVLSVVEWLDHTRSAAAVGGAGSAPEVLRTGSIVTMEAE
ncbi:hypothetical protein [Okibacterium endophyticum]